VHGVVSEDGISVVGLDKARYAVEVVDRAFGRRARRAVCAEQGSRGLYVTISSFHPEAQKLIDKVDNLIGIDGHRIFLIAKKCRYGLKFEKGQLKIDEELFLRPIGSEV